MIGEIRQNFTEASASVGLILATALAGHLTYNVNVIKLKKRDYMNRRVTPPKRVASPTWGPHLHINRP